MKIKLFASAAVAAAMFAAPAFAGEPAGYIDASMSSINLDVGTANDDTTAYSVGGAVAFDAPGAWTMQVDARYTNLRDADADQFGGSVHLLRRGETGQIGGFIGVRESFVESSMWAAGVEGAHYGEQATLSGALGYGQIDELEAEVWAARGGIALYAMDNLRVDAGLEWNNAESGGEEFRIINYGLGAEYQLQAAPISVFGGWDHTKFEEDVVGDMAVDTFKLGLRYNFGAGSLKERDRSGASAAEFGGLFKGGFPIF